MRILGIDLGEKKIGLAVSDPLGWTAQGLGVVISKGSINADIATINEYVKRYEVEKIIIGLPLNMDGSSGPHAEKARFFAEQLGHKLNIPVEMIDERLTTVAAEKLLLQADLSRAKRKKVIDKMAAVLILQRYLDQKH
ncbi:MAG: Holliday junction resolvase RuvX [Peptococcaceae bacterium]|jgi:putative Holliday junction resolvase|nr:Holliday junction resolvase RuvX [Peptococcaceae bacterium]